MKSSDLRRSLDFIRAALSSSSSWRSIWQIFWHSFWHVYQVYLLAFFFAFYLAYLRRFFVVEARRGTLWSWACGGGLAGNTLTLGLLFGSGGERCDLAFAVEVSRGTLWSCPKAPPWKKINSNWTFSTINLRWKTVFFPIESAFFESLQIEFSIDFWQVVFLEKHTMCLEVATCEACFSWLDSRVLGLLKRCWLDSQKTWQGLSVVAGQPHIFVFIYIYTQRIR